MIALLWVALAILVSPFKAKSRLAAENVALRHQLVVLRRMVHDRVRITNNDRVFFVQLYRWFPSVLMAIAIIRPETLVRWHRVRFSLVLALEVALPGRATAGRHGPASAHPADEHREPTVGRATNSWRVAQARALRPHHCSAGPQRPRLGQCHNKPDCGKVCSAGKASGLL
jgi:hypothetical protein